MPYLPPTQTMGALLFPLVAHQTVAHRAAPTSIPSSPMKRVAFHHAPTRENDAQTMVKYTGGRSSRPRKSVTLGQGQTEANRDRFRCTTRRFVVQ
jgi:hypothetical protein